MLASTCILVSLWSPAGEVGGALMQAEAKPEPGGLVGPPSRGGRSGDSAVLVLCFSLTLKTVFSGVTGPIKS